jgi:energy-coupling factor transporter transmembrane protein EcfT
MERSPRTISEIKMDTAAREGELQVTKAEVEVKKAELELTREQESWICCSGNQCSQAAVRFGVSVSAAFLLMAFCVAMLATSDKPDPLFVGLLSLCTGVLLPQPGK